METFVLVLSIITILSEILPLIGSTKANGLLHGLREFILHIHADSDCHVDVAVEVSTPAPIPLSLPQDQPQ